MPKAKRYNKKGMKRIYKILSALMHSLDKEKGMGNLGV